MTTYARRLGTVLRHDGGGRRDHRRRHLPHAGRGCRRGWARPAWRWRPGSWAAVVALAGAFCYGELGCRRPRAGGGYVYLREAWGPLPAFLYGWALLLVIATGAIAAVAVTFADYTAGADGSARAAHRAASPWAPSCCSPGSTTSACAPGAITVNVLTVLKLVALAALIVAGLALAGPRRRSHAAGGRARGATGSRAFGAALVPVLFTYGGWQQTNFIAEEIVAPERTLPRALVARRARSSWSVYLLANLAYLRVLGLAGLAASSAPGRGHHARAARPGRRHLHRRRHRDLDLRLPRPRHPGDAARAPGDGRRRRLPPASRRPAPALPHAGRRDRRRVGLGDRAHAHGHLRAAGGLRVLRRLDLLRPHGGRTVPPARRAIARGGEGRGAPGGRSVPGYPWTPAIFVLAAMLVVVSSIRANPRNAAIGTGLLLLGVPVYLWWRRPPGAGGARGAGEPREPSGVRSGGAAGLGVRRAAAVTAPSPVRPRSASRCSATPARRTPALPTLRIDSQVVTIRGIGVQAEGVGLYGDVDLTEPHTVRLTLYDSLPGRPVADPLPPVPPSHRGR